MLPTMTTPHWNQLFSHSLTQSPQYQQYFNFAIAYLDSAQRLCNVLSRSTRKATYERGAVVLFLAHHALELFYKAAVLRKNPNERRSHNLQKLRECYLKFYPEKCLQIPTLFYTSYEECAKEHAARLQGLASIPIDQLYRYPEAKNGKPWQIYDSFEAFSFSIELAGLRKSINLVWNQIDSQEIL